MNRIGWFHVGWVSFGLSIACLLINFCYAKIQQVFLQLTSQPYVEDVFAYVIKPIYYVTIAYGAISIFMIVIGFIVYGLALRPPNSR